MAALAASTGPCDTAGSATGSQVASAGTLPTHSAAASRQAMPRHRRQNTAAAAPPAPLLGAGRWGPSAAAPTHVAGRSGGLSRARRALLMAPPGKGGTCEGTPTAGRAAAPPKPAAGRCVPAPCRWGSDLTFFRGQRPPPVSRVPALRLPGQGAQGGHPRVSPARSAAGLHRPGPCG